MLAAITPASRPTPYRIGQTVPVRVCVRASAVVMPTAYGAYLTAPNRPRSVALAPDELPDEELFSRVLLDLVHVGEDAA